MKGTHLRSAAVGSAPEFDRKKYVFTFPGLFNPECCGKASRKRRRRFRSIRVCYRGIA